MKKKFTLCLACLIVIMFATTPMAFAQDQKTDEDKTVVKIPADGKNINLKAGSSSLVVGGESEDEADDEKVDAQAGDKKVSIDGKTVKVEPAK